MSGNTLPPCSRSPFTSGLVPHSLALRQFRNTNTRLGNCCSRQRVTLIPKRCLSHLGTQTWKPARQDRQQKTPHRPAELAPKPRLRSQGRSPRRAQRHSLFQGCRETHFSLARCLSCSELLHVPCLEQTNVSIPKVQENHSLRNDTMQHAFQWRHPKRVIFSLAEYHLGCF